MFKKEYDLTGKTFGKLLVISYIEKSKRNHARCWKCLCTCGNETTVRYSDVTRDRGTRSCGCLKNRMKGLSHSDTYQSWAAMVRRCYVVDSSIYHKYGAKGIKVCDRWHYDFFSFLEDMKERPKGMTLDRIDPLGNYSPENCRWATRYQQARNKTCTRMYTAFGKSMILSDWEKEVGLSRRVIRERLKTGLTIEQALTFKLNKTGKKWEKTCLHA